MTGLRNILPAAAAFVFLLGATCLSAQAATYAVLHTFATATGTDGKEPMAGLINVAGTLYGTTCLGGANNRGTVFSITPAGRENIVYAFAGDNDGACPQANLLSYGNLLYGTTASGGGFQLGTVFGVSLKGVEQVSYSFQGSSDGATPSGGLIAVGKHLLGMTTFGGADPDQTGNGNGTIFSITPDGQERQIYQFGSGGSAATDGALPNNGLVWKGGHLYGTTGKGGTFGWGTMFSATLSGQEGPFLSVPENGATAGVNNLVKIGTRLFGTTTGGAHHAGAVIELDATGSHATTLYSFAGGKDGVGPNGGLIAFNGKLYGTTASGGANNLGTVFSLTLSGVETVVHSFTGCEAGENPTSGLVNVGGTLYGTTYLSSSKCSAPNSGVVFAISP